MIYTSTPMTTKTLLACGAFLLAGVGLGVVGAHTTTPKPAQTAPAACVMALDQSDRVLDLLHQTLALTSSSVYAISRFDTYTVTSNTAKINVLVAPVGDAMSAYQVASVECRAAGAK